MLPATVPRIAHLRQALAIVVLASVAGALGR